MTQLSRRRLLAATALSLLAGAAQAQAWPSKPITLVAPFPAGGPLDVVARAVAEQLSAGLKQTVVVDNRAGATGNIGAQAVARAPADGHTLLMTIDTSLTANPTLYGKRMGFDAERDLRPVATTASFSQMLVVNPSSGIQDFKGFIERARKGLNYGSAGNASPGHLTMEALGSLIGGQLNHVPYRGNAPAVTDLLGGQIPAGFVAIPSVAQHVDGGKLKALAVSGSKRSPLAPQVPTVAELGHAGATTDFSFVLMAPAGTPDPVVKRLHEETVRALAQEPVAQRLRALDLVPVGAGPEQTATLLREGRARWARVIQERRITADQ
ncbi:Bug family tripartite tricarboxylate transporter substrate binding protein [Azohydromonas caseinilytica]|uniref:Tripartite tricarboxylate transporter substrate binding protein n=1 Tax=Azohydromonas caseinilytica TaxID=2728836 RepID=A0A848F8T9_9BURK|nr:tripartite tricarboxylate transporter substrate binding protein [Azohydromonas caseinilytica]NML14919.1 tripartite tricarboxylate transporter substrate binding protein [Azohydromonas caseinilytica]